MGKDPTTPQYEAIFAEDRHRREKLAATVQQVIDALNVLELQEEQARVKQLKETVLQDTFKILVLGEFKTGKSTFINALLGQEILPSYATPTTAIINEIKWGAEERAVLHFRQENKQPMEVNVSELETYVVIKDNPQEEIRESPYSYVELFWPLELCRNKIEIIDSPGLNESEVREKVTIEYLRKVDAVLFIMSALRLGPSLHEQETLAMLRASGHEEIFFIVNQFDILKKERDREDVKKRALEQLVNYTKRPNSIHFISSLDALEGRVAQNEERVAQSGLPNLEGLLHLFLSVDRSRIKSKRAAMELLLLIARIQKGIPDKRTYLRTPLAELQRRYDATKAHFDQLQHNKGDLIRRVESFRRDIRMLIKGKTRDFFETAIENVDAWVNEFPLKPKLDLHIRRQIGDGVRNITNHVNTELERDLQEWSRTILAAFIEERATSLQRDLERLTESFEADLRRTRVELLGTQVLPTDLNVMKEGPKNALERTFAAAGGFFVAGLAGAGLGAVFGWREVVNSIIPQILAITAAMLIGLPLLPVAILAAVIQGGLSTLNLVKRIKDEVAKAYKQKLRELAPEQGDKIAGQIDEEFARLSSLLERGLQTQIAEVQEQVESALTKKQQGQKAVDAQLEAMNRIEKLLSDITTEMVGFVALVDGH